MKKVPGRIVRSLGNGFYEDVDKDLITSMSQLKAGLLINYTRPSVTRLVEEIRANGGLLEENWNPEKIWMSRCDQFQAYYLLGVTVNKFIENQLDTDKLPAVQTVDPENNPMNFKVNGLAVIRDSSSLGDVVKEQIDEFERVVAHQIYEDSTKVPRAVSHIFFV